MAIHVTRVEMHGASAADYEALHKAMLAAGFKRTITGDDGAEWALPTATYAAEVTPPNVVGVRDFVVELVKPIHRDPWVLVTAGGSAWRSVKLTSDPQPLRLGR